MPETVQQHQPDGVPPLELTGERTLPDVPAENYWFRRHLAVYEWIAERSAGLEVVDMACGEGYGSDVLARRARRVTGVDANPAAYEHARAKYTRPGVRFARDLIETYVQPCDAVVFLQTIEHVQDPGALLARFRRLLAPGGVAYVSTPNVLTLAPPGAERSGNPWHVREYRPQEFSALCRAQFPVVELHGLFHARRLALHAVAKYTRPGVRFARDLIETYVQPCDAVVFLQTIEHVKEPEKVLAHFKAMAPMAVVSTPNLLTLAPPGADKSDNPWHLREYRAREFRELCESVFDRVELYGLFHARKLALHAAALRLGWDAVHRRLGITERFYDRFTPAIDVRDFALRAGSARELRGALDLVAVLRP